MSEIQSETEELYMDDALEELGERGIEPEWDEAIVAPTFPDCKLLDMDSDTSEGIYLQLVEGLED